MTSGKHDRLPGSAKILAGDDRGYDELCVYTYLTMMRLIQLYHVHVPNHADRDIAHEVTTKVFLRVKRDPSWLQRQEIGKFNGYLNVAAWNLRASVWEAMVRDLERFPFSAEEAQEQGLIDTEQSPLNGYEHCSNPEQELIIQETTRVVLEAMERLPLKRRLVFKMAVRGTKHASIARLLGMNPKSVGAEISRARRDLKKIIPEEAA